MTITPTEDQWDELLKVIERGFDGIVAEIEQGFIDLAGEITSEPIAREVRLGFQLLDSTLNFQCADAVKAIKEWPR